ncbi:MAG: hypothetical protein U0637_06110 [Phycisphaerales bacterium]
MSIVTKPPHPEAIAVEEEAAAVLSELQGALAALVAALPGRNTRAVDLQRTLELDKKLGWQLFTFVSAANAVDRLASIPGAPSVRRILASAARRKAPRGVMDRVSSAFDAFEVFVDEHGGDRDELALLLRSLAGDVDRDEELRVRKSLFRGLAHVWGVRAAALVRTAVVHPSRSGEREADDILVVVGYVGLQRLRHQAPFSLSATVGIDSDPTNGAEPAPAQPANPAIGPMTLLPEYCSKPLPRTLPQAGAQGEIETELLFPPSSRAGAISLTTVQTIAQAWSRPQHQYGLNSLVKVPTESYVCELMVPSGWTDLGTARAHVYGRRGAVERVHDLRTVDLLPQRETVACVRSVSVPPAMPDAPGHHDAVATMISRMQWNDTTYDLYRCVVEYPVLHTMIRIAADAVRAPFGSTEARK